MLSDRGRLANNRNVNPMTVVHLLTREMRQRLTAKQNFHTNTHIDGNAVRKQQRQQQEQQNDSNREYCIDGNTIQNSMVHSID